MIKKKLIEVALPLDMINKESAREKSIRKGHPSTLHLWWARRPLASARAVIWSSLVDDPSSHPELFPTEEDQNTERKRLFGILEELVTWEKTNDQAVLSKAKEEILKSTNGNPPMLLDPFAGGGSIPLEAQRLGLTAYGYDLNPVAVMINKAMIEIPSIFNNRPAINPDDCVTRVVDSWQNAQGLSADIHYYGEKLKQKAFKKISPLYPKVHIHQQNGKYEEATVIAWIWARTVRCPNPACHCETPLVHTFDVCKKKGKYYHISPRIENDYVRYVVEPGLSKIDGTVNRKGARCIACDTPIGFPYIRDQGKRQKLGKRLMCIVAEGEKGRVYLSPNDEHERLNDIKLPEDYPDAELPYNPRNFQTPIYGLDHYSQLFTPRQLHSLTAFCDSIQDIAKDVEIDAINSGLSDDHIPLSQGGSGARAYSDAIAVYLAFAIDKMVDYHSTICIWHTTGEKMANTMRRQAIQMTWDYAESNPMCKASGCFDNMLNWVVNAVNILPAGKKGVAEQVDAHRFSGLENVMVSTDPPYYSNIIYADVSDYFYIWLRKSLRYAYPELFSVIKTPKKEELVAAQYRYDGDVNAAKKYFEDGMKQAFANIYNTIVDDVPLTVFYAYKQNEVEQDQETSRQSNSGWETMISALISSGFCITGTWPMRTELITALKGNVNALASSIVLVCRKRTVAASQITRRNLVNILRKELRPALKKLQESNIAPVDLAQSAIGPGMAVYSRYNRVLEADGSPMSVRSALQIINEEIDLYFNEQIGDMDAMSRFCIDLYTQNAFNDIKFGDADILARAKGTSVATIAAHNVVYAKAGIVHLIEREDLPETIDKDENCIWLLTQQLTQAMATGGVEACAKAVYTLFGSNAERAKDLAYRLYTIAEQKKWASEAYAYNALVVAWPDIQTRAAILERETPEQLDLFEAGLIE